MTRLLMVPYIVVFAALPATAATPEPVLALKGLDPIALIAGQESAGLETLEVTRGLYRYRFATPENKRTFEARPLECGIQFGGACGKMGPLSGNGSPDRFLVHDRRIYIFASESCRTAFKSDPEKHIERPNAVPEGTTEQKQRGAALVLKALDGFGGQDKVDGVKNLLTVTKLIYKQGDKEIIGIHRETWALPGHVRIEDEFTTVYGHVVTADSGFLMTGKTSWPMEPSVREAAWWQVLREPLVMLANRRTPGFVAVARGPAQVGDTAVKLVDVSLHGATSTWSIDPRTGRILQVAFQARRGTVGDNVVRFGDFRAVDRLVLPRERREFFNGKEIASPQRRIEQITVNGAVKADAFTPR